MKIICPFCNKILITNTATYTCVLDSKLHYQFSARYSLTDISLLDIHEYFWTYKYYIHLNERLTYIASIKKLREVLSFAHKLEIPRPISFEQLDQKIDNLILFS